MQERPPSPTPSPDGRAGASQGAASVAVDGGRDAGARARGAEPGIRPATQLLRDLLDVTDAFERSLGAELAVNPTDLDAMEHLIIAGRLRANELARRIGLSTAAMTTSIDRLVALGHARREPDPLDRRGVVVVPSETSRDRAMGRILPMIQGVDRALDGFDAAEQAAITRYLETVVSVYRAHAAPAKPSDAGATSTTASKDRRDAAS